MEHEAERVYTVQQVAEILQVHLNTVYRMVKANKLKAIYIGESDKEMRITATALREYMKGETQNETS